MEPTQRPITILIAALGGEGGGVLSDVMLASDLLEAGRALLNGYVTPERTTLIASTHRIYTVDEKIALGDGRYDSERIVAAAGALAQSAILADFLKLPADGGGLSSAVM